MNSLRWSVLVFLIAALGGFIGYRLWRGEGNDLPRGAPEETFRTEVNGEERAIMVTQGIRHSVPLDEVIAGGPPPDGIPSIDRPQFVRHAEADAWLGDDEPGIAFSRGGVQRFYPYQVLVWHEIVNDTVPASSGVEGDGERVLVTYCPLCLTGFIFDPVVRGERVEFGTSGKLWKSNLVMYDRKTDSLWSQILGEAIVGEMTGTKLPLLPSDQVRYGAWKRAHPGGEVLSRQTGATRFYGSSPYGDYFTPTDFSQQLAGVRDTRLTPEDFVFGIVVMSRAKAYPVEAVRAAGEVADTFQGKTFVLRFDRTLEVVQVFERTPSGALERINPFSAFWFSWAAAHPGTDVYR